MRNVYVVRYVCLVVWRVGEVGGDVVKTRSRGEQGHGGVGKRRHTSSPSRQWQGGMVFRTSGELRGVGSVLGARRRTGVRVRVSHNQ